MPQGIARDHIHGNEAIPAALTLDLLTLTDQAANPDAAGEVQRNGTGVFFHDGTTARSLIGWTLAGKDDTERTTVSLTSVDLSTIAVSIPQGDAYAIAMKYRKTAGAAVAVRLGLKINGTIIYADADSTTATDRAENGTWSVGMNGSPAFPGTTNYLECAGTKQFVVWAVGGGAPVSTGLQNTTAASMPNAAITSIVITGLTGNAAVTLAVDDIRVYRIGSV